jgi:hypothetical protein
MGTSKYVPRRHIAVLAIAALSLFHTVPAAAANGSVVYTYDALGRVSTASYDIGVIIIYAYDANGNRTSQVINVNSSVGTWGSFSWGAARW